MSNTIGYDLEGFANSAVVRSVPIPLSSNVALYLPFDSDLNDDSTNAFTGTAVNGASISTSVKKFGSGSLDLVSSGKYVDYPYDSDFDLGTDNWTFEAWIYQTISDTASLFSQYSGGSGSTDYNYAFTVLNDSNGRRPVFYWYNSAGSPNAHGFASSTPTLNTWNHVALVREGNQVHCFLNGVKDPSTANFSVTIRSLGSDNFSVGSSALAGYRGYIDDFRFTKGVAVYTSNFTPPTSSAGGNSITVENKFLSSVWGPDDVSERMADGTWIRNDVTSGANPAGVVVQGAGLEVEGHRWYVAPDGPSTFIVNMVAGGGATGGGNGTGGGGGGGAFAAVDMLNSPGAYPADGTYTIVVGAEGRAAQPTPYLSPVSAPNGGGGGGGYSAITSAWPGPELSGWDNYTIPGSVTIYAIVGGGGGGGFSRFSPVPGGGAGGGGHPNGSDAPNPSSGTGSPHNGPFGKGGTQSAGGQGAPDRPLGPGIQFGGGADTDGSASWNHGGSSLSTPDGGSGGAGGGGWYGGGSGDYAGEGGPDGETSNRNGTGGGGGSSYKAPTITWFHNDAGSGSDATGGTTGNPGSPTPIGHNSIASTAGVGVSGVGPSTARPGYRGAVQIVLGSDPSQIHDYTTPGIYTVDLTTL